MVNKEISAIKLGDMLLKYIFDEERGLAGFYIIPDELKDKDLSDKKLCRVNNLVQAKLVGDNYPTSYAHGQSMRNSDTAWAFKYDSQRIEEGISKFNIPYKKIITSAKDSRGLILEHIVTYYEGELSFEMESRFINASNEIQTLEMLTSFELGNLTPFIEEDAPDSLLLHRLASKWSHEGRLVTQTIEDLQLEPSWSTWSVSTEHYGARGSMPVCKYFPFIGIEDRINNVLWGAQLAIESSWQMEAYRRDDGLHISGGIADREFGHWMKHIMPGESFISPKAIVTVCTGDVDELCYRLTKAGEKYLNDVPACEQSLPILFNEYCTTWGNPSEENINEILNAIDGHGFEYFVIDCGWFKDGDTPWYRMMGDYVPSKELFPKGLKHTVDLIKSHNLKAGIWFEIDNVGDAALAYNTYKEHMLKRDGIPITTESRRFWDMTDPWVKNYLAEKVVKTLVDCEIDYMKMDYNDTIGIGAENAESLGEGLRQNMEASLAFVDYIKQCKPDIILENCSSGGHKLEPLMMSKCAMASFSDAHETPEIPLVAANLHRAILPRQSQIWCVIRDTDSLKRIGYSLVNTFLGRMCLSGDVTRLTDEKWDVIDRAISMYKNVSYIIRDGYSKRIGPKLSSERHLKEWQAVVRVSPEGDGLIVLHCFEGVLPEKIEIELMNINHKKCSVYSYDNNAKVEIKGEVLEYYPTENMNGIVVWLQ